MDPPAPVARPLTLPPLPPSFVKFLHENHINPKVYELCGELPRFIRIKQGSGITLETLQQEFPQSKVEPVTYLPGFFRLEGQTDLASSGLYKEGRIFGIDVSSGVAVAALGVVPGDHCLDLCAAPGAKLSMLSELCGPEGSVTGVDISEQRLGSCRTVVRKYELTNARLFLADGTRFSVYAPVKADQPQRILTNRKLKKRQRRDAKKGAVNQGDATAVPFYQSPLHVESNNLYDKVLVDAECTHDGSLKHILKYNVWGWENFEEKFMDPERLSSLSTLQKDLISNGYRLLKPGGTLVYSTCSFSKAQNEDIVSWFLEQQGPRLTLVPVEKDILPSETCYSQHHTGLDDPLRGTVRFDPALHGTSGLFVAKFRKADDPALFCEDAGEADPNTSGEDTDQQHEPHKRGRFVEGQ